MCATKKDMAHELLLTGKVLRALETAGEESAAEGAG